MRHKIYGKKLGRSKNERETLFRSLVSELIVHGRIKTTLAKAKAIKPRIDKIVTKGKKATLSGTREIFGVLPKDVALKFFNFVIPSFVNRTSGFSRIIHLDRRSGDNSEMVILEWTDQIDMSSKAKTTIGKKETLRIESGKKKSIKAKTVKPKIEKKKIVKKRKSSKKI